MVDSETVPPADFEDANELNTIAPGTTFVYQYTNKTIREQENVPQLNIFGLQPKDWGHRLVAPIFEHPSVTRYEMFSALRNRNVGQGKEAEMKKEEEAKKVEVKKEEVDAEGEKAGEVEMEKEEEAEEPPKKKIGNLRFWFKDGATDSQEVFMNLMKLKFKIPNRAILIKSQVIPSPTMAKQELDTLLTGLGARESERSLNGRSLCFKQFPEDLTEEVVRESIPDIENIQFKEDADKVKCCIVTLPNPDRAVTVMKEKRGTKAFGGTKNLHVHLMRNLKADLKYRKRGSAASTARRSARGGVNERKRKAAAGLSNGPVDKRNTARGNRPAPFSSGPMARSGGGFRNGAVMNDYRAVSGGFGGPMGSAGGYGAPPGMGGRSGGGGMRTGMGVMGSGGGNMAMMTGGGSGYGMGFPGARSAGFGVSGRAFW